MLNFGASKPRVRGGPRPPGPPPGSAADYGQGFYFPCGFDAIMWAGLGVRGVVLLIK